MLRERQMLRGADTSITSPSKCWTDFCSYFDYLLGLPEESFEKLRLHTYHMTGDNYQTYHFEYAARFAKKYDLSGLTRGIPQEYLINEPEGGIGFHYPGGRFISRDIIRYQRVINTLYLNNIFRENAASRAKRYYALEIGGGYGALAHHLSKLLKNATYVIIDLPETLLLSAAYLTMLNPQKRIYLYDPQDFSNFIRSGAFDSYDFVLLPNYHLEELKGLKFDLVINMASLQEMRDAQVRAYIDFISKTCTGVFYSLNRDSIMINSELDNLSDLLRPNFDLIEIKPRNMDSPKEALRKALKRIAKSAAIATGILEKPKPIMPYREYVCKPRRRDPLPKVSPSTASQTRRS